ncbi:hypothetical protein CLAIMM_06962 [Cladophialophora immunda]|nr:hypothetical protein CLAIMM_06962 [Cladophialophora immunda]
MGDMEAHVGDVRSAFEKRSMASRAAKKPPSDPPCETPIIYDPAWNLAQQVSWQWLARLAPGGDGTRMMPAERKVGNRATSPPSTDYRPLSVFGSEAGIRLLHSFSASFSPTSTSLRRTCFSPVFLVQLTSWPRSRLYLQRLLSSTITTTTTTSSCGRFHNGSWAFLPLAAHQWNLAKEPASSGVAGGTKLPGLASN